MIFNFNKNFDIWHKFFINRAIYLSIMTDDRIIESNIFFFSDPLCIGYRKISRWKLLSELFLTL